MRKKKRRNYKYRQIGRKPPSRRYTYNRLNKFILNKYTLIRVVLVMLMFAMVVWGVKNKGRLKTKKVAQHIQAVTYTPTQEKIAAFEVPVEVSERIFQEAKNNNKNGNSFCHQIGRAHV